MRAWPDGIRLSFHRDFTHDMARGQLTWMDFPSRRVTSMP